MKERVSSWRGADPFFNWKPASWVGYIGALIIIAALLWIAGYLFFIARLAI